MRKTKIKIKLMVAFLSIFGVVLSPASVFAINSYNIYYSGGVQLSSSNVTVAPQLTKDLKPLVKYTQGSGTYTSFSNSALWQNGYEKTPTGACRPIKYLKIWSSRQVLEDKNVSYAIIDSHYKIDVTINSVEVDGATDVASSNAFAVNVVNSTGAIQILSTVYSSAQCTDASRVPGIKDLNVQDPAAVFVQADLVLHDVKKSLDPTDGLYFGITDFDRAQSFKILNPSDNVLRKDNMFVESANILQPSTGSLKNMYVDNGHYIYSQYGISSSNDFIETPETTNIFVELKSLDQGSGLSVVFGFKANAGVGIQYYAVKFPIHYNSDEYGKIVEITDEEVVSGQNPTGSLSEPNPGYKFVYWIADKDVTLENGTIIKAGDILTSEQVKQVVVDQEMTFTAIHKPIEEPKEPEPLTPNTGESTSRFDAILVATPVIGILLGALIIRSLPRLTHKKVKFD